MNPGIKRLLWQAQLFLTEPRTDLNPSGRAVLMAIVLHAGDDWTANPSRSRLSLITGLNPQTVKQACRHLRELGVTLTLSTGPQGRGMSVQLRLFPKGGVSDTPEQKRGCHENKKGVSETPPPTLRAEHYQTELEMPTTGPSEGSERGCLTHPPTKNDPSLDTSLLVPGTAAPEATTERPFCACCTGADRHTDSCPVTYLERRKLLRVAP